MRKMLMIAFLSASVSLIATSLPATQNMCPMPGSQSINPNAAPPPGWFLFVSDPSITGGIFDSRAPAKNYMLTSLIYSLDPEFFQKIFCLYEQSAPCPLTGCSHFALESTAAYIHINPPIKSSFWLPFSRLKNNSLLCQDPTECTFDNNPG